MFAERSVIFDVLLSLRLCSSAAKREPHLTQPQRQDNATF